LHDAVGFDSVISAGCGGIDSDNFGGECVDIKTGLEEIVFDGIPIGVGKMG